MSQQLKNKDQRIAFLKKRIERNEEAVHILEVTANHFYDPIGKALKGWNVLLGSSDKINKLIDEDYSEISKLNEINNP